MHFLTHYGDHCRDFGPMVNYWSFRFESKHGYFKDISSRMKCRRNILKTFAQKHQYLQTWNIQRSGSFVRERISSTGGKQTAVQSLPQCIQSALRPVTDNALTLFQVSSVVIDGITFSTKMAVVSGHCDDELCISRVNAIFIIHGLPVFVCSKLVQPVYWRHCHSYSFNDSITCHLLQVPDLHDPYPLPIYTSVNNEPCVVLKHSLSTGY